MLSIALVLILQAAAAAEPAPDPLEVEKLEQVEVRLVLVDALVLDRHDRTVGGLGIDDFEITVDGRPRDIDTLDVGCAAGSTDDPGSVRHPRRRPAASGDARSIVLVLDYLHLDRILRAEVLDQAKQMIEHGAAPEDRIMVAALNGSLRIEQPFTTDHASVVDTLDRMEYDITLWEPSFFHLNENVFFEPFQALLDVLSFEAGGKALVLFSNHPGRADTDDLFFADLAAAAARSRCSIYPVHAPGLTNTRPG